MKYAYHSDRKSAFEKAAAALNLITAQCKKGSPWQNGIVERSHRTDNEELFRVMHFASSEERRYYLKLWEYEYNNQRPHQGLGGQRPIDIYLSHYRWHAITRMLT